MCFLNSEFFLNHVTHFSYWYRMIPYDIGRGLPSGGACHTLRRLSQTVPPAAPCSCAPPQRASPAKHQGTSCVTEAAVCSMQNQEGPPAPLHAACLTGSNLVWHLPSKNFLISQERNTWNPIQKLLGDLQHLKKTTIVFNQNYDQKRILTIMATI